jgi:hypothetical protein
MVPDRKTLLSGSDADRRRVDSSARRQHFRHVRFVPPRSFDPHWSNGGSEVDMVQKRFPRLHERSGTTAVELAFILPVLLVVYFAMIEFGHCYLSVNVIKSAARYAGRLAVTNGTTNDQVIAEANRVLGTMMNPSLATIAIKDGSVFDTSGNPPTDYDSLGDVQVEDIEERQLFVVRITVPYNSISLFPSGFWHTYVHDLTLSGQAVMRHE